MSIDYTQGKPVKISNFKFEIAAQGNSKFEFAIFKEI